MCVALCVHACRSVHVHVAVCLHCECVGAWQLGWCCCRCVGQSELALASPEEEWDGSVACCPVGACMHVVWVRVESASLVSACRCVGQCGLVRALPEGEWDGRVCYRSWSVAYLPCHLAQVGV